MKTVSHTEAMAQRNVYASDTLMEELATCDTGRGRVVNVAFTDYGGEFFDKVLIAYFAAKHPANIIKENTSYNGQNAFIFGDIVPAFEEETDRYILGFEDLEEFYVFKAFEEYTKAIDYILNEELGKYTFDLEAAREWLREEMEGNYNITTQGVDYCTSSLLEKMEKDGIITLSND